MAAPGQVPELKLFLNQTQPGQQVYYSGQEISGSIQIVIREPKWYQYVGVGLEGKGRVRWTESHTTGTGDNRRTETTTYSDNETYVDLIFIVWGNKEAPQPTKLDPGTFTFPFQFTIPADCPPTFNTHTGHINYQLYGVIASQVNQYKIETPLTLNRLIDLNQQPNLLEPVKQSTVKDITVCCCCKSGTAHITLKMPKTGFCVIQERIPVTFECRNGSSREISVRVELAQSMMYRARGHTKRSRETIGNFAYQIRPPEGETKSVEFDLPQTIQLAFSSRIINVAHTINVWITHSLDFVLLLGPPIAVPITIGNVPFHGQQTAVLDPAQPVPAVNLSPPGGLPPSNVSGYPPQGPAGPEGAVQPLATPEPSTVQATAQPISAGNLSSPQGPLPANVPQAQAGYPPQGLPEPNTVQATASLPTELQSQAPPPYEFAVSEPKV